MGKDLSAHPAPGGQPTEGRFARLTSNLLARKGHAEPSNAFNPFFGPIVPADRGGTGPVKSEEAPAWLSIVNERSLDAGYPANPSGEELDRGDPPVASAPPASAKDAEINDSPTPRLRREPPVTATVDGSGKSIDRGSKLRKTPDVDGVSSSAVVAASSENRKHLGERADALGDEKATVRPRRSLDGFSIADGRRDDGRPPDRPLGEHARNASSARDEEVQDPADDLMRLAAAAVAAAASSAAAEALVSVDPDREDEATLIRRKANDPGLPRRAAVTFRMSTRDFLRMKLGSAELGISSQDILIEALGEYLDARGVEGLGDCQCLRRAADQYEAAAERNAESGSSE